MGRVVLQRVLRGGVKVNGEQVAQIGRGLVVLVGIHKHDTKQDMEYLAKKMLNLQLWSNEEGDGGRWQESVVSKGYELVLVSQFTLFATVNKGKKPNFNRAMGPEQAQELFNYFVAFTRDAYNAEKVQTGRFGEMMEVEVIGHGPVTI